VRSYSPGAIATTALWKSAPMLARKVDVDSVIELVDRFTKHAKFLLIKVCIKAYEQKRSV